MGGPLHVETGVADTDSARVVHLLSYLASWQAEGRSPLSNEVEGLDQVNDPFPLVGTPVKIRLAESPRAVTLQLLLPGRKAMATERCRAAGYAVVAD